ncbi:YibE/F family protein [Ornatilinea apprima]|uniref:YibE/F family protein n=1 Tax=Ornatilinea apprima TaxID=1134406 RepID=UPI00094628C9|nr:YibE/F family protein [Ornatilinea apprima]
MFWEKLNQRSKQITLMVAIGLILTLILALNRPPSGVETQVGYTTDTVKAQVLSIKEQGTTQLGETTQPYQVVDIRILEGKYAGQQFIIDYGKKYLLASSHVLQANEKILVSVSSMDDGNVYVHFVDFIRTPALLVLGILFVGVCVLVSGWQGIRSILGIGVSVLVIIFYIVPQILDGENPILISLLGSFLFLTITQYLVYGWTLKTHIALSGILVSILITGLIAVFFVDFARLNGMGDENAMYLLQQSNQMNLRNLLIAGIVIGALGILDDLVVGQTSAVIEIYRANPEMDFSERFKRSMNVGKDHIAATVNTLVLAYLGASLSLFLLFSNSNVQFSNIINLNYLAEEMVRSLVGTIGLFAAVPITTFMACWVVDRPERLEKLVSVFGPLLNHSEVNR